MHTEYTCFDHYPVSKLCLFSQRYPKAMQNPKHKIVELFHPFSSWKTHFMVAFAPPSSSFLLCPARDPIFKMNIMMMCNKLSKILQSMTVFLCKILFKSYQEMPALLSSKRVFSTKTSWKQRKPGNLKIHPPRTKLLTPYAREREREEYW